MIEFGASQTERTPVLHNQEGASAGALREDHSRSVSMTTRSLVPALSGDSARSSERSPEAMFDQPVVR